MVKAAFPVSPPQGSESRLLRREIRPLGCPMVADMDSVPHHL
jgi:hypothetical protein